MKFDNLYCVTLICTEQSKTRRQVIGVKALNNIDNYILRLDLVET